MALGEALRLDSEQPTRDVATRAQERRQHRSGGTARRTHVLCAHARKALRAASRENHLAEVCFIS
eukprot:6199819-Pleurochrysis_carterae.AAC.1